MVLCAHVEQFCSSVSGEASSISGEAVAGIRSFPRFHPILPEEDMSRVSRPARVHGGYRFGPELANDKWFFGILHSVQLFRDNDCVPLKNSTFSISGPHEIPPRIPLFDLDDGPERLSLG